jgi:hypothetical protein
LEREVGEILEGRGGNGEIQQHDDKWASDEQSTFVVISDSLS